MKRWQKGKEEDVRSLPASALSDHRNGGGWGGVGRTGGGSFQMYAAIWGLPHIQFDVMQVGALLEGSYTVNQETWNEDSSIVELRLLKDADSHWQNGIILAPWYLL